MLLGDKGPSYLLLGHLDAMWSAKVRAGHIYWSFGYLQVMLCIALHLLVQHIIDVICATNVMTEPHHGVQGNCVFVR